MHLILPSVSRVCSVF